MNAWEEYVLYRTAFPKDFATPAGLSPEEEADLAGKLNLGIVEKHSNWWG